MSPQPHEVSVDGPERHLQDPMRARTGEHEHRPSPRRPPGASSRPARACPASGRGPSRSPSPRRLDRRSCSGRLARAARGRGPGSGRPGRTSRRSRRPRSGRPRRPASLAIVTMSAASLFQVRQGRPDRVDGALHVDVDHLLERSAGRSRNGPYAPTPALTDEDVQAAEARNRRRHDRLEGRRVADVAGCATAPRDPQVVAAPRREGQSHARRIQGSSRRRRRCPDLRPSPGPPDRRAVHDPAPRGPGGRRRRLARVQNAA